MLLYRKTVPENVGFVGKYCVTYKLLQETFQDNSLHRPNSIVIFGHLNIPSSSSSSCSTSSPGIRPVDLFWLHGVLPWSSRVKIYFYTEEGPTPHQLGGPLGYSFSSPCPLTSVP